MIPASSLQDFQSSLRQPFLDSAEIPGRRKRRCCHATSASQSPPRHFQEEIAMLELISDSESRSAPSLWLSVRRDSAPSTLTTKPTNHELAQLKTFYVHLDFVTPPPPSPVFLSAGIVCQFVTWARKDPRLPQPNSCWFRDYLVSPAAARTSVLSALASG